MQGPRLSIASLIGRGGIQYKGQKESFKSLIILVTEISVAASNLSKHVRHLKYTAGSERVREGNDFIAAILSLK